MRTLSFHSLPHNLDTEEVFSQCLISCVALSPRFNHPAPQVQKLLESGLIILQAGTFTKILE